MTAPRPWADADDDVLRREYPGGDVTALARRLGRSRKAVMFRARRHLGLWHREPVDTAAVLELVRGGATDRQAAERAGCSKEYVTQLRHRHRLPANREPKSAATRAKLRAAMEATRRKYGVTSLRALDPGVVPRRNAELARRYGLPEGLVPTQVRVLLALAAGPKTADALLAAVGKGPPRTGSAYHAFNYPKLPGRNHLVDLKRRRLICRWDPPGKATKGKGKPAGVYALTLKAISLMKQAGRGNH